MAVLDTSISAPPARAPVNRRGISRFLRALSHSPKGLFGFVLIAAIVLLAVAGPYLVTADPAQQVLTNRFLPPVWDAAKGSTEHLLGGDHLGRDVLARVVYGARTSMIIASTVLVIIVIFGTFVGMIAGYYGRFVDTVLMRIVDFQLSFPFLLLALLLLAVVGKGFWPLVAALAIGGWPSIARLSRGETLRLRQLEFVHAARSIGVSEWRIVIEHILPNILPAIIVLVTLDFSVIILVEAALSFLGLGIQPPEASWGTMISDGRNYLYNAPWMTLAPGICIVMTAIGINLFGDFLRDTCDPRLAGR